MKHVFLDTDVCIDLLAGRKPFVLAAEHIFSLADVGKIKVSVSASSFANIDYVLRSQYSSHHSRQILAQFKTLVEVLPVDSRTIDLAVASDFNDFEDAIQHACAIEHKVPVLITRNVRDYKKAAITVLTPESFLAKT